MLKKVLILASLLGASAAMAAGFPADLKLPEKAEAKPVYEEVVASYMRTCPDIAGVYEAALHPVMNAAIRAAKVPRANVQAQVAALTEKADAFHATLAELNTALTYDFKYSAFEDYDKQSFQDMFKFLTLAATQCVDGRAELMRLTGKAVEVAKAKKNWSVDTPLVFQVQSLMNEIAKADKKSFPVISRYNIGDLMISPPGQMPFQAQVKAMMAADAANEKATKASHEALTSAVKKP